MSERENAMSALQAALFWGTVVLLGNYADDYFRGREVFWHGTNLIGALIAAAIIYLIRRYASRT